MDKPKYSLIEIEKRWLVNKDLLPDISELKKIEITDKYFPDTRIRLRKMFDTSSSDAKYKLTKKYGKISSNSEPLTTLYLSESEYNLYNKLDGNILIKNIYLYPFSGKRFLIEIFIKPEVEFILLEVEAVSEDELSKLNIPDFIFEDVTNKSQYEGYSIANIPKSK